MTALTTIMVATPSITLTTLASALYRVLRYRQQSRYLYPSTAPSILVVRAVRLPFPPEYLVQVDRLPRVSTTRRFARNGLVSSLATHEREQDHVANAGPIEQDHAEAVNADAQ